MPTMCDGRRLVNGKRNPVTLVSTVVARNSAVIAGELRPSNMPNRTMMPDKIPDQADDGVKQSKIFKRQSEDHGVHSLIAQEDHTPLLMACAIIAAADHSSGSPGSYLAVRMVSAVRT